MPPKQGGAPLKAPRKSGAQYRKERREREEHAAVVSHAEAPPLSESVLDQWAEMYRQIGPPPDDAVGRVEWASRICALTIYESVAAPLIRPAAERRQVLEGVRTLGMTAVKALYEERLRKLEGKVYGRGKDADAVTELEESD